MSAINTSVHVRASEGQELMLKAQKDGTNVFVLYYQTEMLVLLRHGTVIQFNEVPSVKMSHGMKSASRWAKPLAMVHICLDHKLLLLVEGTEKWIAVDDLGVNIQATVVEVPQPQVVPDIAFDVTAQVARHGVIAGVEADMMLDGVVLV